MAHKFSGMASPGQGSGVSPAAPTQFRAWLDPAELAKVFDDRPDLYSNLEEQRSTFPLAAGGFVACFLMLSVAAEVGNWQAILLAGVGMIGSTIAMFLGARR